MVWGFFKLIKPFIDPLTREKLKFNEDMRQYVPEEQLWTEFGGSLEFEYDHATYWPALQKLCAERRQSRMKRWVAGGSRIGELEEYLGGGKEVGVAGPVSAEVEDATSAPSVKAEENGVAAVPAAPTGTVQVTEALEKTKIDDKVTA